MEKGGRTKRIAEEIQGLKALGHDVQLVCFAEPPAWVLEQYPHSGDWLVLPKRGGKLDLSLVRRLRSAAKAFDAELLHAHCEGSALYAGIVSRLLGVKCVATVHRSDGRYFRGGWKQRLYFRFVDAFIAVSHERKGQLIDCLGIRNRPIEVVHWGVDLDDWSAEPDQAAARSALQLTSGPVLLSIGHLGDIKGHDESVTALAQVVEDHPDAHLYIAGDGAESDYRRLQSLTEALALQDKVTLLGQVGNVLQWLQASDVFLQPSREEAFGLVFLEAGLCRKPSIATRVGGIPEILVDGETGVLVEPREPQQIADALRDLLASPEKMHLMGEAARARVKAEFRLQDKVARLADYCGEVAAGVAR